MTNNKSVIIFGEVLFDLFPDGATVLGGAPFNVAWHLQAFKQNPLFVSRIGKDSGGKQIRLDMQTWGMKDDFLQEDFVYPTGQVQVTFKNNDPNYAILPKQAYDFIDTNALEDNLPKNGILYHGTLAVRSKTSNETLQSLKTSLTGKVFIDVNLRDPWWHKDQVINLVNTAHWVKLNLTEFQMLTDQCADIKNAMSSFLIQHQLEAIVVTCSDQGAFALNQANEFVSVKPSIQSNIVDTVGAGDAFSAVLLTGLNLGWPLHQTMARAQEFATETITHRGATMKALSIYNRFLTEWNL